MKWLFIFCCLLSVKAIAQTNIIVFQREPIESHLDKTLLESTVYYGDGDTSGSKKFPMREMRVYQKGNYVWEELQAEGEAVLVSTNDFKFILSKEDTLLNPHSSYQKIMILKMWGFLMIKPDRWLVKMGTWKNYVDCQYDENDDDHFKKELPLTINVDLWEKNGKPWKDPRDAWLGTNEKDTGLRLE